MRVLIHTLMKYCIQLGVAQMTTHQLNPFFYDDMMMRIYDIWTSVYFSKILDIDIDGNHEINLFACDVPTGLQPSQIACLLSGADTLKCIRCRHILTFLLESSAHFAIQFPTSTSLNLCRSVHNCTLVRSNRR